jgi:hypothetical protein
LYKTKIGKKKTKKKKKKLCKFLEKNFANFWKKNLKTFHPILDSNSNLVAIFNCETMFKKESCLGMEIALAIKNMLLVCNIKGL